MIDLDDVLAHAHDNCVACEGTGVVRCWSPGGPCPDGQTMCESCGPCQQSDVPALVAALREARAEVERLRTVEVDSISVLSVAWPQTTVPWIAEVGVAACISLLTAERDAWRRRHEALRDGVIGLCDEADRNHEEYLRGIILDRFIVPANVTVRDLRAVVARVEGEQS